MTARALDPADPRALLRRIAALERRVAAMAVILAGGAYASDEGGGDRTLASAGSFLDFTGQPIVTVVVPPSGRVRLSWGFNGYNGNSTTATVRLDVALSGANTVTANTTANAVVTTMGLWSPGLSSVCPPTIAIPSAFAVLCISEESCFTSRSDASSGRSITDCMNSGLFPLVATSFALTFTAYQPALSLTPVIGSDETMRYLPLVFCAPSLTTPKSSPSAGSTTILLDLAPVIPKRYLSMTSGGSFPRESLGRSCSFNSTD